MSWRLWDTVLWCFILRKIKTNCLFLRLLDRFLLLKFSFLTSIFNLFLECSAHFFKLKGKVGFKLVETFLANTCITSHYPVDEFVVLHDF